MSVRLAIPDIIDTNAIGLHVQHFQEPEKEHPMVDLSRRNWLKGAAATLGVAQGGWGAANAGAAELPQARPAKADRHFTSTAVEAVIPRVQKQIADPALQTIFANCF